MLFFIVRNFLCGWLLDFTGKCTLNRILVINRLFIAYYIFLFFLPVTIPPKTLFFAEKSVNLLFIFYNEIWKR